MSTTKRLPAEQRRLQILRSAIKVFAQHTYHGATTRGIAEEAGVTEALIYRYFGSKRVLFTEAIDATAGHIVAGLNRELHIHEADPRQALRACLAYYIGLLERSEDSARMLFLVLSELGAQDVRAAYLPHQRDALKTLAAAITRWQEQGLVRADVDIKSAAWLGFGSYIILALVKHSHGDKATLDIERALGLIQPYLCER